MYASCVERIPEGATRPTVVDSFPEEALAGHAIPLHVVVTHGAGETVLSQGDLASGGAEAEALRKAGFLLPLARGGVGPTITPSSPPGTTTLVIPLLALPRTTEPATLELPPLGVAISRASGQIMVVCTRPHTIQIVDPAAGVVDPRARPNPAGRRQLEPFRLLIAGLIALLAGLLAAIVTWLVRRLVRRLPRRAPAPVRPDPPWEVALRALAQLRDERLVEAGRLTEHVDRTSDVVRRYLGARFGFDGLEATSREIRRAIARVVPAVPVGGEIDKLLDESDLVKFAGVVPAATTCGELFGLAETIVRHTMPHVEQPLSQAPRRRPA